MKPSVVLHKNNLFKTSCNCIIPVNFGVKQGHGLSTTLFNLAIHQAIETVDQKGTIFLKSCQICVYAEDIVIIPRNLVTLKRLTTEFSNATQPMGLMINQEKTKYMIMPATKTRIIPQNISVGDMTFETVKQFKYLCGIIDYNCNMNVSVKDRILTANRGYFADAKLLSNQLITRTTKLNLY